MHISNAAYLHKIPFCGIVQTDDGFGWPLAASGQDDLIQLSKVGGGIMSNWDGRLHSGFTKRTFCSRGRLAKSPATFSFGRLPTCLEALHDGREWRHASGGFGATWAHPNTWCSVFFFFLTPSKKRVPTRCHSQAASGPFGGHLSCFKTCLKGSPNPHFFRFCLGHPPF